MKQRIYIYGLILFSLACGSVTAMEIASADKAYLERRQQEAAVQSLANFFENRVRQFGGSEQAATKLANLVKDNNIMRINLMGRTTIGQPFGGLFDKWLSMIEGSESAEFFRIARAPALSGFLPSYTLFYKEGAKMCIFQVSRQGEDPYCITSAGKLVDSEGNRVAFGGDELGSMVSDVLVDLAVATSGLPYEKK